VVIPAELPLANATVVPLNGGERWSWKFVLKRQGLPSIDAIGLISAQYLCPCDDAVFFDSTIVAAVVGACSGVGQAISRSPDWRAD